LASTPEPDAIARFYEERPYPPPVTDLDAEREEWASSQRRRAEYHRLFPTQRFRGDLDVLVAGCGTSQAARHAVRWPEARVVGIDVSDTSVRHTEKLRRSYQLENLEVRQLPIERAGELERDFDLIICTGVLHHLADPDAGLKALRRVLRPGGAMLIMVYATYGRIGVSMMQEYARRIEVGSSDKELRDLAATLQQVPRDHPIDALLRGSPDFRRFDALADALLNPRERTYTVPDLLGYVERNGLAFGRWYRQAPYLPRCGNIAGTPHAARLEALPHAEQAVAMELLRGSMARHSVIIHGSEDAPELWRYDTGGESWEDAVPIRLPHTLTVTERTPPGSAAVLLNRSHTYPDLVLQIDEREKLFVDAINGQRSIAHLSEGAGFASEGTKVKQLVDRLYWYDQIVIGKSGG